MRTAGLKTDDVVTCSVRGYEFPARIVDLNCDEVPGNPIRVEPLWPNVSYRHLSAAQIVEKGWDRPGRRAVAA